MFILKKKQQEFLPAASKSKETYKKQLTYTPI